MSLHMDYRIRNVTAVLGPTNTGKTHLAIERMLGHETGMIGLPLRLLAREVYDKIVARVGIDKVALITGEEKIKPEQARYWVCTVEAMPPDVQTDFLAIDEIQLAADPERGHVFTDRLLHARGKLETLMLGAGTMRDCIADLIPGANFISRPRLSKLSYAGEKKLTRLPARSAVVTFSANDVYSIAELVRRQRGGCAVVLGALSPRTRNAQVAMYQSGDVDFLIATDAIGMGLNLDVDHVALAATRKFDGEVHRDLTPSELGQIAGRAGRHMNDGTFGVTGGAEPLSADLVERLENHNFDAVKVLQWRARDLDFANLYALRDSLRQPPREGRLQRARMADDVLALETLSSDRDITDLASGRAAVELLWDVCQIPDYRKISTQNHAELIGTLYKALRSGDRKIPEDWLAMQVAVSDRTDGDIDTLSNRLAHIRTWTYVSQRADWLKDPVHWQEKTRAVEDALSDALHEQLTERFVDRRTSALMRGMRDKDELSAEISDDGSVHVEKHFVGRLTGFRFIPETQAEDLHGKATRAAAAHVLSKELGMRVRRVASAKADAFKVTAKGEIVWRGDAIATLVKGDDPLKPQVQLIADEHLTGPDKEKVQEKLTAWLGEQIAEKLKPLVEISKAEDVTGLARGIAFRLKENFGVLRREAVSDEMKSLDQSARGQLRKYGIRFGAFNIFFPAMLKPASTELALVLWTLNGADGASLTLETLPPPPRAGLTSVPADPAQPDAYYRALGFHVCGPRAVRVDMLERLADLIRPLLAWRTDPAKPEVRPPMGSTGDGAFIATPTMMSILGCSAAELGAVLTVLGFRSEKRARPLWLTPQKKADTAAATPVVEPAADSDAATSEAVSTGTEADAGAIATADEAPEIATPETAVTELLNADGTAPDADDSRPVAAVDDAVAAAPDDAPVEEATVAAPVVDTAVAGQVPTEPVVMIEVWRPRRKFQPQHHRGGEGRRDNAAAASGKPGERKPWQRDRDRRHGRGSQPTTQAGPEGVKVEATTATGAEGTSVAVDAGQQHAPGSQASPHQRHERDRHRDRDRDGGRKPGGDARPQHGGGRPGDRERGGGGGGDRGKRFDRDRDRRGGSERPPQQFRSGPSKSKGPDPDSPFAALVALKAALEKGNAKE